MDLNLKVIILIKKILEDFKIKALLRSQKDYVKKVDEYWSSKTISENKRINWWQSQTIIKHINYNVCGEKIAGWNAGAIRVLNDFKQDKMLKTGISIGCGMAGKELSLLKQDVVEKFVCFELSQKSLEFAQQRAIEQNLQHRIKFILGDFFSSKYNVPNQYDFVFWDNSLHHMENSKTAIKCSYKILKPGGIFFCNDYVGKSRFQYSDEELEFVNNIRAKLDSKIFRTAQDVSIPRFVNKPTLRYMISTDPSEAADSERIIPAIKKVFKNPKIIHPGGLVYSTCVNTILQNIEEESELLQQLLELDDESIKQNFHHYAFILARK